MTEMTDAESRRILSGIKRLEGLPSRRPAEEAALAELRRRRDAAQSTVDGTNSIYRGAAYDAALGLPDEIAGAFSALQSRARGDEVIIDDYLARRDEVRDWYSEGFENDPGGFRRGQLAGSAASMLLPGSGLLKLTKGRPVLQTLAMMVGGGVDGANQGIQDAQIDGRPLETLGDYLDAAKVPATVGVTLGAGVPMVGAGAGALTRLGTEALQSTPVTGFGRHATSVLGRYTDDIAEGGVDLRRYLDGLTPEATLSDVPQLRSMSAGLADIGGSGGASVSRALEDRAQSAGTRITADVDARLGAPNAAFDQRRALAADRASRLGPEYDAVLAAGVPVPAKPILDRFDEILESAGPKTTPMLKLYRNDLAGAIDANGRVDPIKLHWLRSDLSDELRDLPRGTKVSSRISYALEEVDRALDAIPGYSAARTSMANSHAMDRAIESGNEMLRGGRVNAMSPDELSLEFGRLSPDQKEAFRKGVREDVAALMGTARNDAAAAWQEFSKGWNDAKLRIVLGNDEAEALIKRLRSEQVFSQTRGEVLAGSRTNRVREATDKLAPAKDPSTGRQPSPVARVRNAVFDDPVNRMINSALYGGRASSLNKDLGLMLSASGPARDRIVSALLSNSGIRATASAREELIKSLTRRLTQPIAATGSSATK